MLLLSETFGTVIPPAQEDEQSSNHVMMLGDHLNWYYQDLAGFNPAKVGLQGDSTQTRLLDSAARQCERILPHTLRPTCKPLGQDTYAHRMACRDSCSTTAVLCVPTPDKGCGPGAKYMRSEGLNSYWSVGSGVYNLDIKVDPLIGRQAHRYSQ